MRSKKSKMIFVRASDSMLRGIKVAKASRAISESCSPTLKSSYASHVTTPPANLLQHHFKTLLRTYIPVSQFSSIHQVWAKSQVLKIFVWVSRVFYSENISHKSQNGSKYFLVGGKKLNQKHRLKSAWNGHSLPVHVLPCVKWLINEVRCSKLAHTIGSVNINSCSKRSPFSSAPLSMLKKFRMNVRAALGSDAGLKGKRRNGISKALDFNSFVQPLSNSCISSGSTSFRVQASPSQSGFGGGAGTIVPFVR